MSHTMTFDTLAFVKKLEASGIAAKQSEAITEAIADVYESNLAAIATKSDLTSLKTDLDGLETRIDLKIDKMALEFDGKLSKLESKIITWVVGLIFAQTALLSFIKFMH